MTLLPGGISRACSAFDRWVREPVDPRPLAWFRAWFGCLCLVNLGLLWPDMPMWLGNDGVLPPAVHRGLVGGARVSVFMATGYDDRAIGIIRGLGIVGGLGLVLGVFPRAAAGCTWLAAVSCAWRNPDILHSGDNLVRIGSFFLMFAWSGRAFSLPRLVARWRGFEAGVRGEFMIEQVPAWPQRILQLQLCVIYLVTGIWKATGRTWRDGHAVGLVLQLGEFQRFPVPDFFMTPAMSVVLTWATLLFELGFPVLVWVPRLRVPVLVAGLAFHAGLDWVMNVQLFQWLITSYYLLFLSPGPRPGAVDQRGAAGGRTTSTIGRKPDLAGTPRGAHGSRRFREPKKWAAQDSNL